MAANGQLPASELAPLYGNPGKVLRKDAANGFNAMAHRQMVHVADAYRPLGHPGDLARGIWSQWAAWERYHQGGPLAAHPGSSNHGWGLAIDLASPADRTTINVIGASFGWSKSWSDAPSEWWHIVFSSTHYHPAPPPPQWPLKQGASGGRVHELQRALRAREIWVTADGHYGPKTADGVREWERSAKRHVDGEVSQDDWSNLFPTLHLGSGHFWPGATKALKAALDHHGYHLKVDSNFDQKTRGAVQQFQRQHKLTADGVVGAATWSRLFA